MKTSNYFILMLLCVLAVSCQNEDEFNTISSNRFSKIEGTIEQPIESRTSLSGEQVLWKTGDALSVFVGSATADNKFVLTEGENTTNAVFEAEGSFKIGAGIESGSTFANLAYYPYTQGLSVEKQSEDYVINTILPETQTYATGSFGQDAFPMVSVADGLNFVFKNVASILKVSLKGEATIIKATVNSKTKKIAGACTINVPSDKIPVVSVDENTGNNMVTLNCGTGVKLNTSTVTEFLFVIPPGTYEANDLVLTFYDSTNQYFQSEITAENTFERSRFLNFNREYKVTGKASGVDAANEALSSGSNNVSVTITANDEDPTLMLPESSSDKTTELSFESIPSDKTVTIQAETESTTVEGSLIVKAPSIEEGSTGNNFVIDLPQSTVTLSAKGESATYNSVTAHTAANTLIVSEGVKITTLVVKGGNVRVKGEISNISRHQDNSDEITYVIKEEGAVIPTSLGDGFKVVSAAEWDLKKAIENGGTYTLNADVALSKTLVIDGTVVLNLGGYNITVDNESTELAEGDAIIVYGNLTLNGEGTVTGNTRAVWARGNGSKVTINGGKYIGSTKAETEVIYASGNGVIDIYGGEFEATNQNQNDFASPQYAVLNLHGNGKDGADINVYGGSFKNFDPANNVSENSSAGYHDGNFVALGYSSVADGNGNYVVSAGIANENALVAAVAAGGTVTLTNNIALSKTLVIDGTVVLNLGGYNITVDNESTELAEGDAVIVYGNLTLNGEGTVTGNTRAVWARGNGSKVTINGGKYIGSTKAETEVIYASGNGVIDIYGGEFEATNQNQNDFASPQYAVLNLHGNGKDGADINVYGGSFKNFDPANNVSENSNAGYHDGNFVALGYSSVADGNGNYVVSAGIANEKALVAAVAAGGTVTLSNNIALSKTLVVDGTVVLNLGGYNITVDNESTELAEGDAIIVYGNLTLNGEGTVTGNTRAVWARGNGSKVTINGGKYIGSTKAETEVIYASGNGVIDIYGGEFEATNQNQNDFASPQYAVLNLHGNGKDGADINVYGGSFKNFDPANNVSENSSAGYHNGNFVVEGYSSVKDGVYYKVSATSTSTNSVEALSVVNW